MSELVRMAVFSTMVITISACGDDAGDSPDDCQPTIAQWCEQQSCAGYETRDQVLTTLQHDEAAVLGARSCYDGRSFVIGDAFNGRVFSYDEDGALVGVLGYADALMEGCDPNNTSAGDVSLCGAESCELRHSPIDLGESDACAGDLAAPLIEVCLDAPPALVEGCETCACEACYPTLLPCPIEDFGEVGCGSIDVAVDCLTEHCADECAAQIAAADD